MEDASKEVKKPSKVQESIPVQKEENVKDKENTKPSKFQQKAPVKVDDSPVKVVSPPVNKSGDYLDDSYMPVKLLNTYSKDFCIKVRICKKADMRTYKNARGEGFILNMDLIDREGTMI